MSTRFKDLLFLPIKTDNPLILSMLISLVYVGFFAMAEGVMRLPRRFAPRNDRGNKTNSILLINGENV